jgi:hypothetical protein
MPFLRDGICYRTVELHLSAVILFKRGHGSNAHGNHCHSHLYFQVNKSRDELVTVFN